jgi:ribose 5-phosphate isomerase B
MRIAIGCDHRGFELKKTIVAVVEETGHEVQDFGCDRPSPSVDYPEFAEKVARSIVEGKCERGILVCSTGIGMSMTANKIKGIRAALCHNVFTAYRARRHNDANVLCLGQDVVGQALAEEIVGEYLRTEFEGRHQARLNMIEGIEKGEKEGR